MYLHPKNKELVWRAIQNSPHFLSSGLTWTAFNQVMSQFASVHHVDLQQHNRETIAYLVQRMKETSSVPVNTPSTVQTYPGSDTSIQTVYTREDMVNQREQAFHASLAQRQAELHTLLAAPKPPVVDFRLPMEDEVPLQNVSELIEQQKRERDQAWEPAPVPVLVTKTADTNRPPATATKAVRWSDETLSVAEAHDTAAAPSDLSKILQFLEHLDAKMDRILAQLHPQGLVSVGVPSVLEDTDNVEVSEPTVSVPSVENET